jgi:tetratricopeptide (TPR) repeat protein
VASVSDVIAGAPLEGGVHAALKMVGRESAIAKLDSYLERALKGQRQVVFITGEAGVGKTTLVDAFHQTASRRQNLRVIRGQCVEGFGGKEAYYPVLEALGQWVRDASGGPVVDALMKQAPTWMVQFPSLVKAGQREALQKEILGATRERMLREISEALDSLTAVDPLVIVLEDLHWVDPSTLDFISALARRRTPAKLLLLGTYRPADVIISQSPLKALKQDLVIHNLSHEISLERLEESHVDEYLASKFIDGGLPAGFTNLIYRHSGGNALFMVTILQEMTKKGQIAQSDGKWKLRVALKDVDTSVPETLDQLIEVQFQQLTAIEQRILRSASVAGERFSVWTIATATELDPGTIEDACERLAEKLQFIKSAGLYELANGQISSHYDFRHSLYREVLYRRLSEMTRSKLHLLLATRLKAYGGACEQELATELALHFEGGHDYQQAIRYLILAAKNAVGRFAYRDSIAILDHALELVRKLAPALRAESEVQIHEFIGDAHFALGVVPESVEAYEAAAAKADQAGLKAAQVHVLICAMYPLGFINPDQGLAAIDQALEMSLSVGDPLLMARTQMLSASCHLVFDAWRQKDAVLCAAAHEELRRIDDDLGDDPYQQVLYVHVLTLQGRYREALRIFENGLSRTDRGARLIPHFGALSAKTIALLRLGDLGEVLRITRAGKELADENLALSWLLSFREAWLRILAFDHLGALQICETIRKASAEHHPAQPQIISQIAAGYRALDRKEYRQAVEYFTQVGGPEVSAKFFLHWMWRMTAQLEKGNAWLLSGNILKARTDADTFLESALSTAEPHLQALAWELKSRVALAKEDFKGAREYIGQAISIVDKFEILVAAWQTHATAWRLYQRVRDRKAAETNHEIARSCILKIADSFPPDEPLRTTFLSAAPVRRVLPRGAMHKAARTQEVAHDSRKKEGARQ